MPTHEKSAKKSIIFNKNISRKIHFSLILINWYDVMVINGHIQNRKYENILNIIKKND